MTSVFWVLFWDFWSLRTYMTSIASYSHRHGHRNSHSHNHRQSHSQIHSQLLPELINVTDTRTYVCAQFCWFCTTFSDFYMLTGKLMFFTLFFFLLTFFDTLEVHFYCAKKKPFKMSGYSRSQSKVWVLYLSIVTTCEWLK